MTGSKAALEHALATSEAASPGQCPSLTGSDAPRSLLRIGLYKHGDHPHTNNINLGRHGRNRSNVLFYPGVNTFTKGRQAALAIHPTCKPVGLLADLLLDSSAPGDLVLDPFGGSGATLIAAEKTDRSACLTELDPAYADAIVRRFENLTGLTAVHVETGRSFAQLSIARAAQAEAGEGGNG